MIKWRDLEPEQVRGVVEEAVKWASMNQVHVARLVQKAQHANPPGGGLIFEPDRWKAAHWKWFLSDRSILDRIEHRVH